MLEQLSQALSNPETVARISIWTGAICTLAIYTFLYRENFIYRLFEHFYLGLAVGYGLFLVVSQILIPRWWDPMWNQGQWWWIFALTVGMMFYFIYSQKHNWVSRLAFGLVLGLTAGALFQDFAGSNLPRITSSFKPIIPHGGFADTISPEIASKLTETNTAILQPVTTQMAINNAIFIFVLLAVMSYFFFSFDYEKRKTASQFAKLGRWMLMFAFGAMFGATVMARMSLLIGRLWYLYSDWLGLVKL